MKVKRVSERPKLFVVSNFLTAVETEAIVETAAPELHPSLVVKHDVVGKLAGIFVAKSDRNKDDGAEDDDNTNSKTKSTGEVSSGRTSWNCRVSATPRSFEVRFDAHRFYPKSPLRMRNQRK